MKTVALHLQKGGVGKTTIAGTLACQSALEGAKTLLIDVDPQGNASSWFLRGSYNYELADVLQGKCFYENALVEIESIPGLHILPTFGIGGSLKSYAENKISDEPFILQDLTTELKKSFDRIVLDLPPGFGKLERAAIIACDEVITPMTPEVFSLDGLEIFIEELKRIRKNLRSEVVHERIIINSFDGRIRQHKEILDAAVAGYFSVYIIPVDPAFRKAQEAHVAPQKFRHKGRGLKDKTLTAIKKINSEIWR